MPLERKSWMSCENSIVDCVSTAKTEEIQNDYLTQTLVFLAGVKLKKINSCFYESHLMAQTFNLNCVIGSMLYVSLKARLWIWLRKSYFKINIFSADDLIFQRAKFKNQYSHATKWKCFLSQENLGYKNRMTGRRFYAILVNML